MIQRIQTVYLLIISVLMIVLLFLPLATVQVGETFYSFNAAGLYTMLAEEPELVFPAWGLFILTAAIAILALVIIFLFKRRILQIRMCVFNALLMIGFYALFAIILWKVKEGAGLDAFSFTGQIGLTFPFICIILDYLAIRNIGADEALVRSLERLR
jgi:peptidoglycan/LPS O-acetylase OafA/YrhL